MKLRMQQGHHLAIARDPVSIYVHVSICRHIYRQQFLTFHIVSEDALT